MLCILMKNEKKTSTKQSNYLSSTNITTKLIGLAGFYYEMKMTELQNSICIKINQNTKKEAKNFWVTQIIIISVWEVSSMVLRFTWHPYKNVFFNIDRIIIRNERKCIRLEAEELYKYILYIHL